MSNLSAAHSSITQALLKNGFPQADLDQIREPLAKLKLQALNPGEILIKEGDLPGSAFITHSGALEVFKDIGGGKSAKIAEVSPGTIVGEMALLTGFQRTATVKAKDAAEVYVVTQKDFDLLLNSSAAFRAKMDALVEERRRELARV